MRNIKREVPEGHAYVTSNGGWAPPTCMLLNLPSGRRVELCKMERISTGPHDAKLVPTGDPFALAKSWLDANAPGTPLYPNVVATL